MVKEIAHSLREYKRQSIATPCLYALKCFWNVLFRT